MLTIGDYDRRLGRRDFLKVGSLMLGGLSLPQLLSAQAAGQSVSSLLKDRSVIFVFMHGGPPQTETFDPKMTAPDGIRSVVGEVATSLPGVTFGSSFPRLAAMAHKMAVVRSFTTGNANHDIKPIVCNDTLNANLGCMYSRVAGINHPITGMPTNIGLFSPAVDPNGKPATKAFGDLTSTGTIGAAYAPFVPGAGGNMQQDMKLTMPMDRIDDRRGLLSRLDQVRWAAESGGYFSGLDRMREQAFSTILGGVAEAFDLSKEDPATIARYDTAPLIEPSEISRTWNNWKNYIDNARNLGKLLLLARRLCENGAGFVTVTTSFVWDMHADSNNATIHEGMYYMGLPFDYAVSALLEDLEARGLSNKVLVVCCGEIGRTPKINKKGGRDHWGNLAPLMVAGGGLQMGKVVGQSTRDAGAPQTDPITISNLVATIMHSLFHVSELRLARGIPSDVMRLITGGDPIAELV